MTRREFLQHSAAAVAGTSVFLSACKKAPDSQQNDQIANDRMVNGKTAKKNSMTLRTNPNTGDKVSILGFGMMRLPVQAGGTARENPNSPIDQDAVNEMVDYALAHGVNYFDTSPAYCQGMSEHSTGIALSRHPRKDYFIATKLSNFSPDTWSAKESKAMFENSLRELRTDYIDYLLLHGIGMSGGGKDGLGAFNGRYIDNGILDWLVEQKRKGRIRNLGFSYHGDIKIFDMLLQWHDENKYHWDFAQIELNYLDWAYANEINPRNTDAEYLYNELKKRNIPAVIMEPLLGGRLAQPTYNIARKMNQRDSQFNPAAWAFRFAGTPEGILTVLSGMTYLEHLQANIQTYSPLQPLDNNDFQWLLGIAKDMYEQKVIPCTTCNYCMPCPYGLNIPRIFEHYNKSITEGLIPSTNGGKPDSEYMRRRRAFLISYDRTVPPLRQADHCIGCNHCVSHCPQRIDIPKEMQRIDRLIESIKQM